MGDSRAAYRAVIPPLVAAGYRVAAVDLRGCGESSVGWPAWSRTAIAGDLLAVVRHLGGPAVLVGHSISGGAGAVADHRGRGARAVHPQAVDPPRRPASEALAAGHAAAARRGHVRQRAALALVPRRGLSGREAGRLDRAARPRRLPVARAGPDEGPEGHGHRRPGRCRRPTRQRPMPEPRLDRPARGGLGDRRRSAGRPRQPQDDRGRRALPARPVLRRGGLAHAHLPPRGRRPCLGPAWTSQRWSRRAPPSPTRWASPS
ncbi:alpha/beta fold hydrolase [Streptomyces niveus]|uniref:alpha/beta fold hydrolase n=1 Tax=Streptomyces niveus TaxID=193462 RepID=UPI0036658D05